MSKVWHVLLKCMENDGIVDGDFYTGNDRRLERYEDMKYLQPIEPATCAPCYDCSFDLFDVVWLKDADQNDRAYICCAECGPQEIDPRRLKRWQLNKTHLLERLMRALEFAGSPIATVPDLVWLLGQRDGIEYFYVQRTGMNDLRTIAATLSQYPKSVVLTSRNYCVEALRIVLPQPCIALETITTLLDDGTIAIDHDAITEHIKVAFPELSAPPFEFRKKGQGWVLRFEGKETFLKDGVGPHYLSLLLKKPFKQVFAVALHAMVAGQTPDKEARVGMAEAVMDDQTQKEIEGRLRELAADIAEAKEVGDCLVEQESQEEYNELLAFYQKNIGLAGQVRKEHDASAKIRQAVLKAIQRTIILIEDELPECAAHLEDSIVTGSIFNYIPVKVVPWVL